LRGWPLGFLSDIPRRHFRQAYGCASAPNRTNRLRGRPLGKLSEKTRADYSTGPWRPACRAASARRLASPGYAG